ncbi:helix-turn-helix domain-containing protein [Aeoliella sp.]|uniref:helix-turn-helix domain-containing protein n=1 Tax=Aeoliella sp. TaxID=2795800 RepID=UPI003CCC1729
MARPRVLDDVKKGEIAALVSAGMSMASIARYVGCDRKTIRRERSVDEAFDERIRKAEMGVELRSLQAIRNAASTHWRAAAWLIERKDKQRAERRKAKAEAADKVTLTRVELVKLAGKVKESVLTSVVIREDEAYVARKIDQAFVNVVPELAAKPEVPDDAELQATINDEASQPEKPSVNEPTTSPPTTLPPAIGPVKRPKWKPVRGQTYRESITMLEKAHPEKYGPPAEPEFDLAKELQGLMDLVRRERIRRFGPIEETCGEQRGGAKLPAEQNGSLKAGVCDET